MTNREQIEVMFADIFADGVPVSAPQTVDGQIDCVRRYRDAWLHNNAARATEQLRTEFTPLVNALNSMTDEDTATKYLELLRIEVMHR